MNNEDVKIYSPKEMATEVEIHLKANMPLMMAGKPGQGKSTIVKDVCNAIGYDLMTCHPVVDSPIDYKGLGTFVMEGKKKLAEFLPFGDLRRLIEAKKPLVHFADDLGPSAKMVQAAYGQLLLNRAINGNPVSPHVRFIAATNRKEDKSGVQGIIEMLKDRFHTIAELGNSLEDWVKWAINSNRIAYELISYVRYRPEILDAWEPTSDMSRNPTPRSLEQLADKLNAGIPRDLQLKSFTGTIGIKHATEFVGFLRIYQDLPDPDAVIMDPKNAEVPDASEKPGNLYALCGALAARATTNTIERVIEYANRLPDEFSVLLVKDATARDEKKLTKNKAFLNWVSDHQDVLI